MFKRFTLIVGLALVSASAFAETKTETVFDATADGINCDNGRIYLGNGWGGTLYTVPTDNEKLASTESSFVKGNKIIKIQNDAFKQASSSSKLTFTIGWTNGNSQFQLALGELNDSKTNNFVECKGISGTSGFEVSLAENGDNGISSADAVSKLKEAGYITIDGHEYDLLKVTFTYDDEGGDTPEQPDDTFSGVAEIQGLDGDLTGSWSGVPDGTAFPTSLTGLVWVKPAYMPALQKGDAINVYFEKDGGQGQFFYRNADNSGWIKAGDNGDTNSGYWDNISASHTYKFPVNSDAILASLKEYGLYIDGHDNTVVKVEFVYNKHAEEVGEIKAEGGDTPEKPETPYTTRVLWERGQDISSVNGTSTTLILGDTWLSRHGKSDGEKDDLSQAFHIPAEKFFPTNDNDNPENADLDDCIVVTFSEFTVNKAQASFYFCDNEGVWFKRGIGDSNSVADAFDVDHNGEYERYILNYRTVAALRAHGLYIDGRNAHIKKIELRNYSNDALSDAHPYFIGEPKQNEGAGVDTQRGYNVTDATTAAVDWTSFRRIRPVAFQNYVNGERIVLIFNQTAADPQLRLDYIRPHSANLRTAQGLTGTNDGIATKFTTLDDGRVAIVYRPTQREIRALKHNGLFLSGQGLELSEITFGLAKADDQTQDLWIHNDWMTFGHSGEGKIYEGDVYYSGDVKIYISNIHFQRAKDLNWLAANVTGEYKGYKLTFYFPWAGNNASMTLSYDSANVYDSNRDPLNMYYDAAYPQVADANTQAPRRAEGDPESGNYVENHSIPASDTPQYLDIALDSDQVKKMIKYGVWIQGNDADFQNAYLRSPISVSGIDSVEQEESLLDVCINFNEPYEAYTIDGRRVADINDRPGLYIVRQGNKVQKILKR